MNNEQIVKYETTYGEITLSPNIIKKYLVSGKGTVTEQEIMMFLALCKYQKLNPFLREVYLIKYGSEKATMVTGKETFLKRACRNPRYKGHKTNISEDGKIAWAEVYVEDYDVPIRCEVDYKEYVGLKQDGNPNRMWKEKPRTMLKKVALVQALREAFPEDLGGLYSQEEISSVRELSTDPVIIDSGIEQKTEAKKDALKEKLKKEKSNREKETDIPLSPGKQDKKKEYSCANQEYAMVPEETCNKCSSRVDCPSHEIEDAMAEKTPQEIPEEEIRLMADSFIKHIEEDIKSKKHLKNWSNNNKANLEKIKKADLKAWQRIQDAMNEKFPVEDILI